MTKLPPDIFEKIASEADQGAREHWNISYKLGYCDGAEAWARRCIDLKEALFSFECECKPPIQCRSCAAIGKFWKEVRGG